MSTIIISSTHLCVSIPCIENSFSRRYQSLVCKQYNWSTYCLVRFSIVFILFAFFISIIFSRTRIELINLLIKIFFFLFVIVRCMELVRNFLTLINFEFQLNNGARSTHTHFVWWMWNLNISFLLNHVLGWWRFIFTSNRSWLSFVGNLIWANWMCWPQKKCLCFFLLFYSLISLINLHRTLIYFVIIHHSHLAHDIRKGKNKNT